jgi:hypothetical protein
MQKDDARKLTEEEEDEAEFARLQRWDAKMEADFQRAVRATKAVGQRKRGRRHVGFPWAFLVDVCRSTEGRAALIVAIYIYRRTHVCRSQTVTLPAVELAELGIARRRKNEALARLQAAELIRVEGVSKGRSAKVTLLWQPR